MNERQWWSTHVQPRLHKPNDGMIAWKVQDAFIMGRPDVLFNIPKHSDRRHRLVGWLELKYDEKWPARESTRIDIGLTVEQHRHLVMWQDISMNRATGMVLFGVAKSWYLFDAQDLVVKPGTKWTKSVITSHAIAQGDTYGSMDSMVMEAIRDYSYKGQF